jgi:hypothetical protein
LSQIDTFRELFVEEHSTDIQHPFWVLRRVFQRGYPLMMLFNIWENRFNLSKFQDPSAAKAAIYWAISAFSSVPEFKLYGLTVKTIHDPISDITDFLKVGTTLPSAASPPVLILNRFWLSSSKFWH